MSMTIQNRMLHILCKRKVSREHRKLIIEDLKNSGIFDEDNEEIIDVDWEFLEEEAYWLFESKDDSKKRLEAIKSIQLKKEEFEKIKKTQFLLEQEERIQAKRQELIEKGVIKADLLSLQQPTRVITRYGRTPLHEAISIKDIKSVEKYLKNKEYLDKVDNNGHTAMEMAYYENYQEALVLFQKYIEVKKTG